MGGTENTIPDLIHCDFGWLRLDPRDRLRYGRDDAAGDYIVTILGELVTDASLAELSDYSVSYLFARPDGHDRHGAIEAHAASFGVRHSASRAAVQWHVLESRTAR